MKGFKPRKLKLKSKQTTSKKTIIIAIVAILVIAIAVGIILLIPKSTSNDRTVQSISIDKMPDKTVYFTGEAANYDGLRILVKLNNGETYIVTAAECQITGFSSLTPVDYCTIVVTYQGQNATFPVVIKEAPKTDHVLAKISLETLPKTEYKVGENLSAKNGVILCEYQDGTTHRINLNKINIYGFDKVNGPGTYTLTVRYEENGITCSTTYTITVTK